ncbi:ABC transporter permease [Allorhizocola rhizosphaerae]|uniref:ABC transporter permease n=1 Tax=Allorhizocola rhizosphaerae TaxID=1872709 RepID=UPI000E3C7F46|nr:ABC transporter permease [Allorhizocola rhizosphaerae]
MSFWQATRLVAHREILVQVRGKGLWITFGFFVVGLFAAAIVPGLAGDDPAPTVAVVGRQAERTVAATDLQPRPATDVAQAQTLVRDGEVDAAVVDDPASTTGLRIIAMTQTPYQVMAALAAAPPVDLLAPDAVSDQVLYLASFGFALIFFIFAISGVAIAQSVMTEKQTRIVEILVATVPVRALLTGKIAAYCLLVFGQVGVLALLTPIALRVGDLGILLTLIGPALGWFVPFFMLGYVLLASMWAVAGALVSRAEDLTSSSTVITILVMVPYLGVTFFQENDLVMTILSYMPFSSAVAMPVRMFAGEPQLWEPFVSLAILAATLTATVMVATRLYTGSLLQTGARVRLRRAWTGAETPLA